MGRDLKATVIVSHVHHVNEVMTQESAETIRRRHTQHAVRHARTKKAKKNNQFEVIKWKTVRWQIRLNCAIYLIVLFLTLSRCRAHFLLLMSESYDARHVAIHTETSSRWWWFNYFDGQLLYRHICYGFERMKFWSWANDTHRLYYAHDILWMVKSSQSKL